MTVDATAFKRGMRHLAASVTLITTRHRDLRGGLTATAVCSVSAEPPQILVCVNKTASAHDPIGEAETEQTAVAVSPPRRSRWRVVIRVTLAARWRMPLLKAVASTLMGPTLGQRGHRPLPETEWKRRGLTCGPASEIGQKCRQSAAW